MAAPQSGDFDSEYGLVMPFVVCKSQGGPFDDEPFVAGWRCGAVDCILFAGQPHARDVETGRVVFTFQAHEAELPQLDLIAMRRGFTMTSEPRDDGWVECTFLKNPSAP